MPIEYLAGALLFAIGLFFIPLRSPLRQRAAERMQRPPRPGVLPAWLDLLILWGMGLVCLLFGVALLLGRVRF